MTDLAANPNRDRRETILLVVAALLVVFAFNGARPLFDTSETRYAEAAREMAASGEWLVPRIAGKPHLTKPPMAYWIYAGLIRIFGTGEFWIRLGPGLFFVAGVLMVRSLGGILFRDVRAGRAASWVHLLSVFPLAGATVITTDTFLATLVLGSMWCFWGCMRCGQERGRAWWRMGFHAFLGLAFLTKGPPGLVPLAVIIPLLIARRRELPWKSLPSLRGTLVFLVLALAWPLAVAVQVPDAWTVWKHEAIQRVFEEPNHEVPRSFFLAAVLFGALPGALTLPWAWTRLRRARAQAARMPVEYLFLALWVVIPVALYSMSKTRLYLYVLPVFPAVSLFYGAGIAERWRGADGGVRVPRAAVGAVAAFVLLFTVGKYGIGNWLAGSDPLRNLKTEALAIREDCKREKALPRLVLFEPRLGNGILYYLDGPPVDRLLPDEHPGGARRGEELVGLLRSPVSAGYRQYFVFRAIDNKKIGGALGDFATVISKNTKWVIMRRSTNAAFTTATLLAKR